MFFLSVYVKQRADVLPQSCNGADNGVFPGTALPNCQGLAADIQACQARGKIITLSLGGATGAAVFSSDAQASTFADTIWNLFLGGSSSTRPFGNAVLDGYVFIWDYCFWLLTTFDSIDLDIEGGSSAGYPAFITRLQSHTNGASKKYVVVSEWGFVMTDILC